MNSCYEPVGISKNRIKSCACGVNFLDRCVFESHPGDSQAFLHSASPAPCPALPPTPRFQQLPWKMSCTGIFLLQPVIPVSRKAFINPTASEDFLQICFLMLGVTKTKLHSLNTQYSIHLTSTDPFNNIFGDRKAEICVPNLTLPSALLHSVSTR